MLSRRVALLRLRSVRCMMVAASERPRDRPKLTPLMDKRSPGVRKVIASLPAEHVRLQNRHRDALESNRAESLQEVIEQIEWRGIVFSQIPEKVAKLLRDPKEDLTLLSDRQIAVLLSTFGNACESVSRSRRGELLREALETLKHRGVPLLLLSRNAALSARVDNGENVNVIEELSAWDAENLAPDKETYGQLSRVYARSGNTQAIIDIINHMKSIGLQISPTILKSLIYSLAKSGHYTQAETFVEKFLASADEVLLRTAIARAAVARGDFSVALNTIASIPIRAKLEQITNNKLVLQVLFDMLDAGEMNAVEKLSPYLAMTPDGTSLSEWHVNPAVLARSRCACSEGKLENALKLYGLLHPKFRNSNFESTLLDSLGDRLKDSNHTIDDIFGLARSMEKIGLTKDHYLLLLEKSINSPRTHEVLSVVQSRDQLERCLIEKPSLRKGLARKLSEKLTSTKLKKEQRVAILADIATVLFSYDSERPFQDVLAVYPVIYALGGKDVDLAIPALAMIKQPHVRKEYSTALVQQLLRKGDPLAEEKLEKLLGSGAIQSLSAGRVQKQISGLVLNRDKKEGESDKRQLNLAARLIALSFPAENSKARATTASKYVILQLQSELLSVDRARKLVSFMEKEPRIRLSSDEISLYKKALQEKGQKEKGELLGRLRKKSQTYARWLESSVEELEEELAHIREKPDAKPAVVKAMHEVILKKVSSEKPINYERVERQLRLVKENASSSSSRVSDLAIQIFSSSLTGALLERKLDVVKNLWEIRMCTPSVENALTYISYLFLTGSVAEADTVCEDLRQSAQTITATSLQTVGDRLGDSWSIDKMRQLSQYLQTKFNLGTQQLLRIIACVRLRQLERLIDAGKLDEALQLVVEHSVESNSAFGQYQLAAAAVRTENMGVLKGVFDVVKRTHGKEVAFLDLALVLLEEGRTEQALKLLDTPQLKISQGKLEYFVRRAVDNNRPDVLRGLFTGLSQHDRVSTVGLNKLLLQLSRMYYKANDLRSLESLEEDIKRMSFPLEQQMRTVFDNLRHRKLDGNADNQ
ncbi:hypothetical protein RB195_012567 [Necator americanus]|uniref:Leucine-rich PPR motif-containing protein, mitochondrial n=1 Tax=Necator americanus TaxID=51031 RepID=A0ABR1DRK8_NECAM